MDHLIALSRNPVPTGAIAGRFPGHDGVGLRYARWPAALRSNKGTVCLFGGRTEFIEKYFETIADLRRRGFAVATMDWRGQGGSDRLLKNPRKGHVEDFAHYEADVGVFMRDVVLPDCPPPYFALAHSMGGAVLLRAARAKDCWFDRMVLASPLVGLANPPAPEPVLLGLTEAAVFLGLGEAYVPGAGGDRPKDEAADVSLLTSDPRRLARNLSLLEAAPELAIGAPTVGWLRAALATTRLLQSDEFPPTVRVPVLFIVSAIDGVVSPSAIERLTSHLKIGEQVVIPGGRHELMQERNVIRDQFWAALDAFLPGSELELKGQDAPALLRAGADRRLR